MYHLTEKDNALLASTANKYSIDLFVLFGSQATGQANRKSDIDIAYHAQKNLTLEQESQLVVDLARVFKNENIDLVNITFAPPLLRYAIFKDGLPLFEQNPLTFASFSAYAFKQYIETKQLYNARAKKLFEAIQQL